MSDMHAYALELLRDINTEVANQLQHALDVSTWHPEHFRVGVVGLYNAGKSTTLNALVDDITCTTFVSGDVPTTKHLQYHRQDGVELMDTPGLDVDPEDDANAFEGLRHCDVILLVHSLSNGELDMTPLQALKALNVQDPQPLAQRLIAVWTCASEVSLDETPSLAQNLSAQLHEATGGHPLQVSVDNMTYLKALRNHKPRLKAHSGIPALKQHIAALRDEKGDVYQAREARRCHQLRHGLAIVQQATQALKWQQEEKRRQLAKDMREPLQVLSEHRQRLIRLASQR